jgi:hypothetical protein
MPYIKKEYRHKMDVVVANMIENGVLPDGKLNYVLYKFCKMTVQPGYNSYKNFLGEIEECVAEIRRRLLAPYEDKKIQENGDVV